MFEAEQTGGHYMSMKDAAAALPCVRTANHGEVVVTHHVPDGSEFTTVMSVVSDGRLVSVNMTPEQTDAVVALLLAR